VAIGTDTGGSVRIPAALCGVVGFKPTLAAVSTQGVYPLSPTLDSVGVLARSVADCAAVFNIIRDDKPLAVARPLRGARLAVITNYVTNGVDADVGAAFDAAVSRLAVAGADIASLALPELDQLPDFNRKGTLVMAEAFAGLRDIVAGRESQCDPLIIARILAGGAISADDYTAMKQRRAAMQASALARLEGFDAYLMPTVPIIAPTIDSLSVPERYHAANGLVLRNPSTVNFLGGCAISLPCQDSGKAPVGLALCARAGEDDKLLALALDVEAALRR
jgi:aspartyl-tRNA(Asn)/glutamyl-tRNA(Gln) amidotransferase subunit A